MNNNMDIAVSFYSQRNFAEADKIFREILKDNPQNAEAWHYMGLIAFRVRNFDVAVKFLDIALSIKPSEHFYLDKGNILGEIEKFDEAVECYKKVLELNPVSKDVYNNLGVIFEKTGNFEKAINSYKKALEIMPDSPFTYTNLGVALNKAGYIDEAIRHYLKAIELNPNLATAHYNLAIAYENDTDKAIFHYKKTLELDPDYKKAYLNLAISYLLKQDFVNGWKCYEKRFKALTEFKPVISNPKPKWDGSSLKDKIIYIYHEQGLGDTIQFCRFLPLLNKFGAKKVLFKPQSGLETLLKQSDLGIEIIDNSIDDEKLDFDVYLPLLSLLSYFQINTDNITDSDKYLKADANKIHGYKKDYFNHTKFKIGICWQGNQEHPRDKDRSIPLEFFYPLFQFPNVQVYSLQKGHGIEQLHTLPEEFNLINLGETFNDFSNTAAAIENLDLVISIDTATAHLAGALGKPTWIILPTTNDWRWFFDENKSVWYNSVKLFRPLPNEDRVLVMERIFNTLKCWPSYPH